MYNDSLIPPWNKKGLYGGIIVDCYVHLCFQAKECAASYKQDMNASTSAAEMDQQKKIFNEKWPGCIDSSNKTFWYLIRHAGLKRSVVDIKGVRIVCSVDWINVRKGLRGLADTVWRVRQHMHVIELVLHELFEELRVIVTLSKRMCDIFQHLVQTHSHFGLRLQKLSINVSVI